MEHGATRNFQAEKLIEEEEKRFQKEREEEELNNPMKVLENRTKDSKMEMDVLENMQELIELNQRQANVDFESMLDRYRETEEEIKKRQEEEDEKEMRAMLAEAQKRRRLVADSDSDEEFVSVMPKQPVNINPTGILTKISNNKKKLYSGERSESNNSKLNSRQLISGLVKKQNVALKSTTTMVSTSQDPVMTYAKNTDALHVKKAAATLGTVTLNNCETIPQSTGSTNQAPSTMPDLGASSLSLLGMYSDSEGSD
ncbi:splicing factor YJU2 [Mixophyes fleayi]|uniref:splicing factor YJU2 n=1 Tax=Mixophyes fleayi TaxID=3061075 RepID=UPI003F4DD2B5